MKVEKLKGIRSNSQLIAPDRTSSADAQSRFYQPFLLNYGCSSADLPSSLYHRLRDKLIPSPSFYGECHGAHAGKLTCRREVKSSVTINIMGDKSPKSNQEKSTRKHSKANSADQAKKQAVAKKKWARDMLVPMAGAANAWGRCPIFPSVAILLRIRPHQPGLSVFG